jgi:hypothetical protein
VLNLLVEAPTSSQAPRTRAQEPPRESVSSAEPSEHRTEEFILELHSEGDGGQIVKVF